MPDRQPELRRVLTLPMLVLYGLGTIIGAGIYALIGEIAGIAGYAAPLAFLLASVVAGFTACSFAELSARYPRAAGAALYVQQGFGIERLSLLVGLLVVMSGVVSAAALVNGFTGYLQVYLSIERSAVIVSAGLLLGAVAAWGIIESVTLAALITVIEIGGLLVVIGVGASELPSIAERWREFLPSANSGSWSSLVVAATLAFYAFIGFEDMVDVAEEVKDVRHTMPTAILLTLAFATLLYMTLMVSALLALPPQVLAASDAPIATLYAAHTDSQPVFIGLIAMFAIINGALVQIVMASRVLYGLGSRRQLPAILSRVDARTKTPLIATAIVTIALVALALFGRLASLATATAVIMLSVFTAINLALWRIKGHKSTTPPVLSIPRWMPMVGALLSGGLVIRELLSRL